MATPNTLYAALFGLLYAASESLLGWKQASFKRHLVDVVQCIGLFGILGLAATRLVPMEIRISEMCASKALRLKGGIALCKELLPTSLALHQLALALKVLMLMLDIARYHIGPTRSVKTD